VTNENLTTEQYNELSNRELSNDEGWQAIADDLTEAYNALPVKQADKGAHQGRRSSPPRKVYLYKATVRMMPPPMP
jgi:hypothetical protein